MKFEKDIKNSEGKVVYTIGITRTGKGQPFNWKSVVVPHLHSLHTMSYSNRGYDSDSLWVPMFCQIFWIGLIFYIKVGAEKIGESRFVSEHDHFGEIQKTNKELRKHIHFVPDERI